MKQDDALYIKISGNLKAHVNQYVTKKKVKGGVSELIRKYLTKKTNFKEVGQVNNKTL